ncbi:CHAT domain-containing protein [Nocardia aurea]|uniref:CHAT domain-containing protein n=1 Tax=Nocardia aurea TaxID=2144174 RepID=A0ABV3G563_9NOCA
MLRDLPDSYLWDAYEALSTAERGVLTGNQLEHSEVLDRLLDQAPARWIQASSTVETDSVIGFVLGLLVEARGDRRTYLASRLDRSIRTHHTEDAKAFYRAVFEEIDLHLKSSEDTDVGRYFWCSTWINISKFYFQSHDPDTALVVAELGWLCMGWFPTQFVEARLKSRLAVCESMARVVSPHAMSDLAALDRNRRRVNEAAQLIESLPRKDQDVAILRIRCGLSEARLWEKDEATGWIPRVRAAYAAVRSSLAWYIGDEMEDEEAIMRRLVEDRDDITAELVREALDRLLNYSLWAGTSYTTTTPSTIALLEGLDLNHRARAKLLLDLGHASVDQRMRNDVLSRVALMVHTGEMADLTLAQRTAVASRYQTLAYKAAQVLSSNQADYSAGFWRWESRRVARLLIGADRVVLAPEPAEPLSFSKTKPKSLPLDAGSGKWTPADISSRNRVISELLKTAKALRAERPRALAAALRALATMSRDDWLLFADIADSIVTGVTQWCDHLAVVPAVSELPVLHTDDGGYTSFKVECLLLVDAIAQEFHPDMRAQTQKYLANIDELPSQARVMFARNAVALSYEAGRWIQGAVATITLLQTLHDSSDRVQVSKVASDLCDSFLREIAQPFRGVELYELLKSGSETLNKVAEWLASNEYPREAFLVVRVAGGWLCQAMAKSPDLVDDYEAIQHMRFHKGDKAVGALYQQMERRMLQGRTTQTLQRAGLPEVLTKRRALVQFLVVESIWALVATPAADGTEYIAIKLPIPRATLPALAERIWAELRPARAGTGRTGKARRTGTLARLHTMMIAPLEERLADIDEVVFTTDGDVARLPLHAARGPHGFLVERIKCRYSSHRWNDQGAANNSAEDPRRALVGGWDPEIGGPVEAKLVTGWLNGLGYVPDKVRNAQQGRIALLDESCTARLLHLVAHGELRSGLLASESKLKLSPSVSITARDWMRGGCHPAFAFLNACDLGGAIPHSGDLSGFPLALRIRGAHGSLTALEALPSQAAHRFADTFYGALDGTTDTFTAYLRTVRQMIGDGNHPANWAAYVYEGGALTPPGKWQATEPSVQEETNRSKRHRRISKTARRLRPANPSSDPRSSFRSEG